MTKFDYIIIGAGSAGCVVANRLSENPAISVLLLEAGGKDNKFEIQVPAAYSKLNRSKVDWAYYSEPQIHVLNRRIFLPRGKTLGGSSSTNAMAYIRGNKEDYNDWAKLGNEGWSYEEILPYFIKSEHNEQFSTPYHGKNGLLNVTHAQVYQTPLAKAFVKACEENGIPANEDFNGQEQEGAGLFQFTIKDQKRHSTASAFLKPILHRPNLKVITNAHTRCIILEGKRAVGVEYLNTQNKQIEKVYANAEVILSAGAFNSPQILLLSGIGEGEELTKLGIVVKHELKGVGKNLQDHLFCSVSSLCKQKVSANHHLSSFNQLKGLLQYLLFKKGPFTISPLEANAFVKSNPTLDRPDFQLHFAPVHLGAYSRDLYDIKQYPKTDGYTILPTLLKPKSRGYVTLKSSNPLDAPVIQPRFLEAEEDRKTLITAFHKAYQIMQADAFSPYRIKIHFPEKTASEDEIYQHILKTLETVYHPVGTCKMGNDEDAVVDAELKVRGIASLRVIDASIMPTIVSGNTNAAAIMIGEKGADLVKGITQPISKEVLRNA